MSWRKEANYSIQTVADTKVGQSESACPIPPPPRRWGSMPGVAPGQLPEGLAESRLEGGGVRVRPHRREIRSLPGGGGKGGRTQAQAPDSRTEGSLVLGFHIN